MYKHDLIIHLLLLASAQYAPLRHLIYYSVETCFRDEYANFNAALFIVAKPDAFTSCINNVLYMLLYQWYNVRLKHSVLGCCLRYDMCTVDIYA